MKLGCYSWFVSGLSELETAFGRTGSAEGSGRERVPDGAVYESPRLRALGTLAELARGLLG
jgi:hypothetical protein